MLRQKYYYGLDHLHYLTRSSYRRARLLDSERFKSKFVTTLARVTLPPSVRDHAHFRVEQQRFYDMNNWSPKRRGTRCCDPQVADINKKLLK